MMQVHLKIAVALWAAAFVVFGAAKSQADSWSFSAGFAVSPIAAILTAEHYDDSPLDTGSGGRGGSVPTVNLQVPLSVSIKASRTFSDLGWSWTPGLSGELSFNRTIVRFPEGALILSDPFDVNSKTVALDLRTFVSKQHRWWNLSSRFGIGHTVLKSRDHLDYGILQLTENRTENLSFVFASANKPVWENRFGTTSIYTDFTFSRLGPSVSLGLEQSF